MTVNTSIDRGWAWVITFAVFGTNILCVGYFQAFGIFFVEIIDTFHTSSSLTSLIMGIQNAVCCVTALLVHNVLLEIWEVRTCALVGGFVMASGMMLGMFADNVPFLIFTLSVLVGVGNAFTYGPGIVLLGQYFFKRRALANSLASMGSSVGSMLLPVLATYLVLNYGLRGSLLLYGAVTFHICVFASLYRPLPKSSVVTSSSTACKDEEIVGGGKELPCERLVNDVADTGKECKGETPMRLAVFHTELCVEKEITKLSASKICVDRFQSDPSCLDHETGHDKNYLNESDPNKTSFEFVGEDCKMYSSTGDIFIRSKHIYDDGKRSASLANVCVFPDSRGAKQMTQSVNRRLRPRTETAVFHLSHPHLLIEVPALKEKPPKLGSLLSNYSYEDTNPKESTLDNVTTLDTQHGCRKLCKGLFCDATLLRMPTFWLVQAYVCAGVIGATGGGSYMPVLMQEKGLKKNEVALTFSIWGACNLLGRFLCGMLADRKVLRPATISTLAFQGIGLLFMAVSLLPHELGAWAFFAALYGLLEGGFFSMLPDIIINMVNLQNFSKTFGFAMLSQGVFAAMLFPILGWLKDVTGNYHATFYLLGACALTAAALLLLVPATRICFTLRSRSQI